MTTIPNSASTRKLLPSPSPSITQTELTIRLATSQLVLSYTILIILKLVSAVVQHIVEGAPARGGILIFLSGVQEIRQCIELLKANMNPSAATIFPLHANLSSEEQRAVFGTVLNWKIVVATNVAEVGIG